MKLFLLTDDLSDGGPPWINTLKPMLGVFSESFDITLLQVPPSDEQRRPQTVARFAEWRRIRSRGRLWEAEVRRSLAKDGPNILMVWAPGARLVWWSHALRAVWDLFSHRVLHVIDTLQPEYVSAEDLARFDLVTCFCRDLGEAYGARSGRPTLFFPAHVDTLAYHSARAYRPIDLLVVGRREDRWHLPLFTHFNAPERERLFIDFTTRGQSPMTREQEFSLLMSAHAKSAAAFCYEPGGVPRFCGRSPLLERWVHAWTSGCTVFGTRPLGGGTAELMDWPEATIELPQDPREAVDLVERTLSDEKGMERRRHRNVLEAVRRHDTRYRIAELLRRLDLPIPTPLQSGFERLEALQAELAANSGRSDPFAKG